MALRSVRDSGVNVATRGSVDFVEGQDVLILWIPPEVGLEM